jgi:serine/threonine protein kinase
MKQVEKIFSEAVNLHDPAARRIYLNEACQNDAFLLEEIKQLIAAHESAGEFLRETAAEDVSTARASQANGNSAADIARAFFQQQGSGIPDAEEFLRNVPAELRSEVLERIRAAQMGSTVIQTTKSQTSLESAPPAIDGFQMGKLLGKGGLGTVYQAYDQKLQRQVAIKVLARGENDVLRNRILAEARKAASLRDPAIVTVYSVLDEGSAPAINMELVEGFSVDRATASLSVEQKVRILQQIARAISVAHRAGVIHRDLKPENVLVTPDLQPKILDFGLAVTLEEGGVRRGFFEGTPRYASPEQVGGRPLTPASDVFSFGSLMFKVLTGRPPFDGSSALEILEAICTSEPPFLKDVAVGVPEDLQAICLACLAWKPEDRPTAMDVAVDLGRFLAEEPVRLRPALYGDILRRRIAEHSSELLHWKRQGMISGDEQDRLEAVHRRILADEDHWIVDSRKVSIVQTILYTGTWLVVISAVLTVWLARKELPAPWLWLAPLAGTVWLIGAGLLGSRRREPLASASFLAGAVLSLVPTLLAVLNEISLLSARPAAVKQLLTDFSNAQILAASATALGLSVLAWTRLRMTGFAWTTAVLAALTYWTGLLCVNWLDQKPEIMAFWLLPLTGLEAAGLVCERKGRVRWAWPFHLVAFLVLVVALDIIALQGPTFALFGIHENAFAYLTSERQRYFSLAANGYLFLALMLITEQAKSLDLRRASRVFEPLALVHMLGPLYANAHSQKGHAGVGLDVGLYIGTVVLLLLVGPWRSRWRILIGALGGVALGSYLLIDLDIVRKSVFTLGLGFTGLIASGGMYVYLLRSTKPAASNPVSGKPTKTRIRPD